MWHISFHICWPFYIFKILGHLVFSILYSSIVQIFLNISSVQLLSHVWLFATPWTAACQVFLSITNSRSLLKLLSIELVMPSNHLILCCPLLLLPSAFPSIRAFSNEKSSHQRLESIWNYICGLYKSVMSKARM